MSRQESKTTEAAPPILLPPNIGDWSNQTETQNCDAAANASARPPRPPPVGARPVNGIAPALPPPPPAPPGSMTNGGRRSRASLSPPSTFQVKLGRLL
jgi:hypothetical protein